ncbi:MAG: hypothetical protein AB4050_20150 [Synechococcus sp.]
MRGSREALGGCEGGHSVRLYRLADRIAGKALTEIACFPLET